MAVHKLTEETETKTIGVDKYIQYGSTHLKVSCE